MRSLFAGALCTTVLCASALAQTLTIGVRGGPDSIDPHFTATGTHAEALKHVFDTLVWSGDGLEIEPRLAESWKAVDDTTWEFKLRSGVKFHDGSDFTAEDVKFSIERMPIVDGPEPDHDLRAPREGGARSSIRSRVHVVTDGPAPNLPNDFIRLFIVSHKAAAGLTKENANEAFNSGKAAVGTGPYKFVSWTPKGDFVARALRRLLGRARSRGRASCARRSPNDAARVAQLKAGQLDLITRVPASDVADARSATRRSTVAKIDTVYVFNLEMDMREQAAGRADHRQGRLGAAEEPVSSTCACARRSISPSTARRSPRSRWKASASR